MNKHIKEIIEEISREFAECRQKSDELEAKSLFRLLNFSLPEDGPEEVLKSPDMSQRSR
jgi:hypothetical protein